jgi:hypothetical protein
LSTNVASVLSNSSLDVSNESLTDLPSFPFTSSLASQMAVRNFLLHFSCDSWMARIPFSVSLPQFSTSPEELTFTEHSNILEFCNLSYKNMKVFDPFKYPTVTHDFSFVDLGKDLEVLALKDDFIEYTWIINTSRAL